MSDTKSAPEQELRPPIGFRFGAVAAGIKEPGGARDDLALIVSDDPLRGRRRRAPSTRCAPRRSVTAATRGCPRSGIRAIVANSGNANALTGPVGAADERAIAAAVAKALGVERRRRPDGLDGRDRHRACRSSGSPQRRPRWWRRWATTWRAPRRRSGPPICAPSWPSARSSSAARRSASPPSPRARG